MGYDSQRYLAFLKYLAPAGPSAADFVSNETWDVINEVLSIVEHMTLLEVQDNIMKMRNGEFIETSTVADILSFTKTLVSLSPTMEAELDSLLSHPSLNVLTNFLQADDIQKSTIGDVKSKI